MNPISWFEIYVNDIARAQRFYETVLATPLEKLAGAGEWDLEMCAFPMDEGPGASGALVKMKGMQPGGSGTIVYFSCKDCAQEESRIIGAGGVIAKTKSAIGEHGFYTLGVDPEGNTFGLHSMA